MYVFYIYIHIYAYMGIYTGIPFWAWSASDHAKEAPQAPDKIAFGTFWAPGGTSLAQSGPDHAQKGMSISEVFF